MSTPNTETNADPTLFPQLPAESVNLTTENEVPKPKPIKTHKWTEWWHKHRTTTETSFSKNGITHNEQHESLESILKACRSELAQIVTLVTDMIKWIATRLFKYLTVVAITAMIITIAPNLPAIMAEAMALALKYGLVV